MTMNTFDEIIQTKAYQDLDSDELEVIRELVSSEEEYNEMKSFYAGIGQLAISGREEVSVSVKSSLNSVFQAKHPGINQNWTAPAEPEVKKIVPLVNRNLFRIAALLVLSAGVTTIWFTMSENQLEAKEKALSANNTPPTEEKQEAETKQKFPLNGSDQKKFTAASDIPADKNLEQPMPVTSNATSGASFNITPHKEQAVRSSANGTYQVHVADAAGTTFYFSSEKAKKTTRKTSEKEIVNAESKDAYTLAGLDADLHPGGFEDQSVKDYKPGISTTDMLSLIEPSF
jgi:hypothetical protein